MKLHRVKYISDSKTRAAVLSDEFKVIHQDNKHNFDSRLYRLMLRTKTLDKIIPA